MDLFRRFQAKIKAEVCNNYMVARCFLKQNRGKVLQNHEPGKVLSEK